MKKYGLLILCALLCMMSGCGNDEEKISDVSGKVMLVVGMDCQNQPFAYETNQQGPDSVALESSYATGFDVRLARYLAKTLQREITVVNMKKNQMVEALDDGTIDMAISALQAQDDDQVDVSSPYYEEGMVIVVRKDSKLAKAKKLGDFAQKKIMAVAGTNDEKAIAEIKDAVHEQGATDYASLQKTLIEKKCDGIIVPASQADIMIKTNKDLVIVAMEKDSLKTKNQYVIMMEDGLKDEEESLYHEIEEALSKLEAKTKTDWMKAN